MGSAATEIAAALRGRIASGELAPGDRLPSARAIARDWQVALATATRVQMLLRDEGLTEALPGVGTVVRRQVQPVRTSGPLRTEVVVAKAVAIADSEGLDAVSMRRLAVELATAPTALYRHVADKDDLVRRMIDAALAGWQPPSRGEAGWRECLEAAARGLWQQFQRHPWLAASMSLTRPVIAPRGIAWTEWTLDALSERVPDPGERFEIHLTLFAHVRGLATNLEPEAAAAAATGLDVEDWMDEQLPALRRLADPDRHPHFSEIVHTGYDLCADRIFERGLAYLLDGLALRIDPAAHSGRTDFP